MKKFRFTLLVAAILSAAWLAGCLKSEPIDNPEYTTTADGVKIIDEYTAKRAAAQHIGVAVEDVLYTHSLLTWDDGKREYEIEFIYNGYEYEFEVSAKDGRITDYDKDRLDRDEIPISADANGSTEKQNKPDKNAVPSIKEETAPAQNEAAANENLITKEDALRIALEKAGIGAEEEQLEKLKIELDTDYGKQEYEVDFCFDGYEYEYDIDAVTGSILYSEKEIDN